MELEGIGRLPLGTFTSWSGLAPDDAPLLSRDISVQEVYSVQLVIRAGVGSVAVSVPLDYTGSNSHRSGGAPVMLKPKTLFSLLCALCLLHSCFQPILAQSAHVVTPGDLQQALMTQSANRQASIQTLDRLFSRPEVAGAVGKKFGSPEKIMKAVAVLDDAELARLAERAQGIQQDFAAGALSNQDLTYIVIALGTAVLILIIIAAGD